MAATQETSLRALEAYINIALVELARAARRVGGAASEQVDPTDTRRSQACERSADKPEKAGHGHPHQKLGHPPEPLPVARALVPPSARPCPVERERSPRDPVFRRLARFVLVAVRPLAVCNAKSTVTEIRNSTTMRGLASLLDRGAIVLRFGVRWCIKEFASITGLLD